MDVLKYVFVYLIKLTSSSKQKHFSHLEARFVHIYFYFVWKKRLIFSIHSKQLT